jgi:hypothetical protein
MNQRQLESLRGLLAYLHYEKTDYEATEAEYQQQHIYNDIRALEEFANDDPKPSAGDDELSDALDKFLADGGETGVLLRRVSDALTYAAPQQRADPESDEETEYGRLAGRLEALAGFGA